MAWKPCSSRNRKKPPDSMRVVEPTANWAGSPNLKTRSGPGCTAGLGKRITPASAVPIAIKTPHKAVRPRKSRRLGESGICPLLAEQESLHRDGVRRAALSAQSTADTAILVFQNRRIAGACPVCGQQRVNLGRRRQLLQRDQFEAQRGTDIHA